MAKQIISGLRLKVPDGTVLRVFNESGEVKRPKSKRKPLLTSQHKTAQIESCKFNIDREDGWKTLFSRSERSLISVVQMGMTTIGMP